MTGPQAFRHRDVLRRGVDVTGGGLDGAVRADHEGSVELRDFLDALPHSRIREPPLGTTVPANGIETRGMARLNHLAGVADHEQRPDRLALAALPADLDGEIDNQLERLERHLRLEVSEVAAGELTKVLLEPQQAHRVDRARLEPAIDGHHLRVGSDDLGGDALQQGLR